MDEHLELGRYTDDELVEIAEGDAHGGSWWTVVPVSVWVSDKTCPTTACTDEC
jgi:hypothetical protein